MVLHRDRPSEHDKALAGEVVDDNENSFKLKSVATVTVTNKAYLLSYDLWNI
jgi:hypothetical protein